MAPRHTLKVDRVALFGRVPCTEIVLVSELVSGEDHRDTDGCQEAGEGQLDPFLGLCDAVVLQEIVEAFIAIAFDVVAAQVVDCLGPVVDSQQAAVDEFVPRPSEARFICVVVPRMAWRAILLKPSFQSPSSRRCFSRSLGMDSSSPTTRKRSGLPRHSLRGEFLEFLHEVPIRNVDNAVRAQAIDTEIGHPTEQKDLHELSRRDEFTVPSIYRVVGVHGSRITPQRASEAIPPTLTAGLLGVRVIRLDFRIDVKVGGS